MSFPFPFIPPVSSGVARQAALPLLPAFVNTSSTPRQAALPRIFVNG